MLGLVDVRVYTAMPDVVDLEMYTIGVIDCSRAHSDTDIPSSSKFGFTTLNDAYPTRKRSSTT